MKVEIIDITPSIATEMLTHNIANRPTSEATVRLYATLMREGKWRENGEAIQFGADGRLLNGQHRLKAIVASETTQKIVVIRDVDSSTFATFDAGRKRRPGDVFALKGVELYNITASATRMYVSLSRDKISIATNGEIFTVPTNEYLYSEVYLPNQAVFNRAVKLANRCYKKLNFLNTKEISGIYAFLVIDKQYEESFVEKFFIELFFATEMNQTIGLLRDRLIKDKISKTAMRYNFKLGLIAKTWNAYVADRKLRVLSYNEEKEGKIKFN